MVREESTSQSSRQITFCHFAVCSVAVVAASPELARQPVGYDAAVGQVRAPAE